MIQILLATHQSAGRGFSVSSFTWQSLFTFALYSDTDCTIKEVAKLQSTIKLK